MSETQTAEVSSEMTFEIIEPKKSFIDETEWKEIGEFEKIIEETETIDWIITTTMKIVPMSDEEIIQKKIKDLKIKVALGTATATEKSDLKLLIG